MKVGKHTKANAQGVKAERPNIRTVPLSKFKQLGVWSRVVPSAVRFCESGGVMD